MTQIDSRLFRDVLGRFPTGVTVVTSSHEDTHSGIAIGSFFSISLEPALVGFCVGSQSASWAEVRKSNRFVVNLLADDQVDLSNRFASKDIDRFADLDWTDTAYGPQLDGCLGAIHCSIERVVEAGDHHIVIGAVEHLEHNESENHPLVFFRGGYHSLASE
jgi:3-hydroxy-9,10-secoandrosta-1,3,5(10)-triene-9,17-dione monooxygenase reductase component